MQLLIYEHISGGGCADEKMSPSILSEGYGMLSSLVSDFKAAGHGVTTLFDSRLRAFDPPLEADHIVSISSSNELNSNLKKLAGAVDAVYVIAPESGHTLQSLVELVEASGGLSLNSQINAIAETSNKKIMNEVLEKKGLVVPETVVIDLDEDVKSIIQLLGELDFPLLFKPVDGASCSGLSIVKDGNHVNSAVKKIARESSSKHFVAQNLIRGINVSVSVLSTGEKALPITLNKQIVTLASPHEESSYNGGVVPFDHALQEEALKAAQDAVVSVRGLKGYIGVDMVLTSDGPVVIEINPRLTTSYVGLRRAIELNLAQGIVDAVLWGQLPGHVQREGCAVFSKVEVPPVSEDFSRIFAFKEIVSPPFPVVVNEPAYALLATHSGELEDAQTALCSARKRLLNTYHTGD